MKKTKIQIKSIFGKVLFEHESEGNTIKETAEKAVLSGADLSGADLSGAVLSDADLRGAVLRGAVLRRADLSGAVLSGADLSGAVLRGAVLSGAVLSDGDLSGAVLSDADLRGVKKMEHLPEQFINLCSRDMLFVFQHLKAELPYLRKMLVAGKVDGSQYEGDCACLIGTIAKKKGNGDGVENTCSAIPYYNKGTHNMGETWFLSIHKGDTPKNSIFAKHAVKLIDDVLKKRTEG